MIKKLKYFPFIIIFIFLVIVINNFFNPPDWVELHLEKIPTEVDVIYLVVRERGDIFPLKWYHSMVFPFISDANVVGEQWYWTVSGDRRKGDVQWRSADSYGILSRRKSGDWVLWWLDSRDIKGPSPLRYILGGGGKVSIQTSGIESAFRAPRSLTDRVKH